MTQEENTQGMVAVELLLNEFWKNLPSFPKYKDFNKEMKVVQEDSVKKILKLEKDVSSLHLHSKSTNKQVVYTFLTLLATITHTLVGVPLAALLDDKDRIVGWQFYKEKKDEKD